MLPRWSVWTWYYSPERDNHVSTSAVFLLFLAARRPGSTRLFRLQAAGGGNSSSAHESGGRTEEEGMETFSINQYWYLPMRLCRLFMFICENGLLLNSYSIQNKTAALPLLAWQILSPNTKAVVECYCGIFLFDIFNVFWILYWTKVKRSLAQIDSL